MSLLKTIKKEIEAAGGNMAVGYEIVIRSPYLFSQEDIKYFTERHRWNNNRRKKRKGKQKERTDIWSEEDIQFVINNFGSMKTANIGKIINRSSNAIRQKFREKATEEQKLEASTRTNKSRKKSNFK